LKNIEISINTLNLLIKSKTIVCPNVDELNLYIDNKFVYNNKEIFNIFPNIITLKIYIKEKYDLLNLMREIKDLKIENLKIFNKYNEYINSNIVSKIILNIENLIIDVNY